MDELHNSPDPSRPKYATIGNSCSDGFVSTLISLM